MPTRWFGPAAVISVRRRSAGVHVIWLEDLSAQLKAISNLERGRTATPYPQTPQALAAGWAAQLRAERVYVGDHPAAERGLREGTDIYRRIGSIGNEA